MRRRRGSTLSPIHAYMAMAGGFYTSAPDLLRLMDGVLGGDVLSPASRQSLMRVNMPEQHYAVGGGTRVETIAGKPREAAWEDGSNGNFRLLARRVLADGHTVIALNNTSFDYEKLGRLGTMVMEAEYTWCRRTTYIYNPKFEQMKMARELAGSGRPASQFRTISTA